MSDLMGRNQYARHRGCAPNAVAKAISSGRIKDAVEYHESKGGRPGKFKGIRWKQADQLWAVNTDPVEAARNGKVNELPGSELELTPSPGAPTNAGLAAAAPGNSDNQNYLQARATKEQFAAKNAELEYLKAVGQLVEASSVAREVTEVLTQLKISVMRIPERKAQNLAAETDPTRVHRILSEELRMIFDECSRRFAEDDPAGRIEEPAPACS